jgi:hypothetical protein
MGMEKYIPNRARFFVRKKYKTFSTEEIVALRSVNRILAESYDLAASFVRTINNRVVVGILIPLRNTLDYEGKSTAVKLHWQTMGIYQ